MPSWKWGLVVGALTGGCGSDPVAPCEADILVETLGIIEQAGGSPMLFSTMDSVSASIAGQSGFAYLEDVVIRGQATGANSLRFDIPLPGFLGGTVLKLQMGGTLAANEVIPVDGRPEGNPGRAAPLVPEASGRLEFTNLGGRTLVAHQGTLTVLGASPFHGRWAADLDGGSVATNTRVELAFTLRSCPR